MTNKQKLIAVAIAVVAVIVTFRFTQGAILVHTERVANRYYAETITGNDAWILESIQPNPNASPSRMDVTYKFESRTRLALNLVVSIPNPNKIWYDKIKIGDTVRFIPTLSVGDNSPDPTLSTYIRPQFVVIGM